MTTIIIITTLFIVGSSLLLRQVLKSKDDIDFTVSFKKGEMNVKKKRINNH